jgi:hypothetical protein
MNFMRKKGGVLISIVLIFAFSFLFNLVGLLSAESGSTSAVFYVEGMICNSNSTSASWVNGTSLVVTIINSTSANCNAYGSCCPTGQTCNLTSGKCGLTYTARCSDYVSASSCNSDILKAGLNRLDNSDCGYGPLSPTSCRNFTNCSCIWNATRSSCDEKKEKLNVCLTGTTSNGYCQTSVQILEDNCNSSLQNMIVNSVGSWIGSGVPNVDCNSSQSTYACVYTAKLDFISDISVFIIVLVIILVYFWLIRRRKSRKKKI